MNETDKLIEEQLKTLPPNLQQAVNAVPWKNLVQEIGRDNTLNAEQITALEQEMMLVIYGFENPQDYIVNLVREVGVSEDVAYTIAESVANKIFDPILKKSEELVRVVPVSVPEIAPVNLPMVEEGEVAHDVKSEARSKNQESGMGMQKREAGIKKQEEVKIEQSKVPLPDYRYTEGKDPYREPLK